MSILNPVVESPPSASYREKKKVDEETGQLFCLIIPPSASDKEKQTLEEILLQQTPKAFKKDNCWYVPHLSTLRIDKHLLDKLVEANPTKQHNYQVYDSCLLIGPLMTVFVLLSIALTKVVKHL
jgi:hypothetical protein